MKILSKSGRKANRYKKKRKVAQPETIQQKKSFFPKNMAMDLGTSNTLIYLQGEGLVLQEPTVVAYDTNTMEVLAVGSEAKSFIGRTPLNIKVIKPLATGVIEDLEITQAMIREFFVKVQKMGRFFKPKAVVCVPSGITKVEEKSIIKAASESGIGRLFLIEEPIAAAIGSGLDIDLNRGQMVVNIGGGITDIAVLSMSSVAYSDNIRIGGDTISKALQDYILAEHSMKVGENSAEQAKIKASSIRKNSHPSTVKVLGKNAVNSIPMELELTPEEIWTAVQGPVEGIIEAVCTALDKTPPDMVIDIGEDGINLTGGGAIMPGISAAIKKKTSIHCNLPPDPLTTVINGTGKALENIKFYKKVFI